ncbi:ESX secretion-associated protein EspG [Candidatus Chloroploca sp. M-50]|uniref:ESX secretion-associated protein EspG n=1 Tax=Candidatus Chloroploca mongolica TaxID=2528176 RepID=A0ABS4DFL5_9CHLR|nr:ESX secretion-associated protein EspG [Candidatus Chloroploca mongolica]MBP1468227.1 ESX secretion-associated protein EspG [Candidatus Chloroploca mongolica]
MPPEQSAPPATAFTISQTELESLQEASANEAETLVARLQASGADAPTAGLFAELLSNPRDSAICQAINRTQNEAEEQTLTFTILSNHHGFWLMQTTADGALNCQPAAAADLRAALAQVADRLHEKY